MLKMSISTNNAQCIKNGPIRTNLVRKLYVECLLWRSIGIYTEGS